MIFKSPCCQKSIPETLPGGFSSITFLKRLIGRLVRPEGRKPPRFLIVTRLIIFALEIVSEAIAAGNQ